MKRYLIRSLKYFAALCVLCMAIMALNLTTGMASLSLEETLYVMFHTPRGLLYLVVQDVVGCCRPERSNGVAPFAQDGESHVEAGPK